MSSFQASAVTCAASKLQEDAPSDSRTTLVRSVVDAAVNEATAFEGSGLVQSRVLAEGAPVGAPAGAPVGAGEKEAAPKKKKKKKDKA